jgi:hypothetical protein
LRWRARLHTSAALSRVLGHREPVAFAAFAADAYRDTACALDRVQGVECVPLVGELFK